MIGKWLLQKMIAELRNSTWNGRGHARSNMRRRTANMVGRRKTIAYGGYVNLNDFEITDCDISLLDIQTDRRAEEGGEVGWLIGRRLSRGWKCL